MAFSPDVPAKVPAAVPAGDDSRSGRTAPIAKPKFLTRTREGWRFQMRLPVRLLSDSFLAKPAPIIRASLGPMPVRKAEILAQHLATLCRTAVGMAKCMELGMGTDEQLLERVLAACLAGIADVRRQPQNALALARGLSTVHSTLMLVATETSKGGIGLPAVVDNAPGLVQGALAHVLALSEPGVEPASIDVAGLLPSMSVPASVATATAPAASRSGMPTFGEVSARYIEVRRQTGAPKGELDTLSLRRKTFIDVVGDRSVDQYFPRDLQDYVTRMQFWPANATKRIEATDGAAADWNTGDILDANSDLSQRPMARKTMADGYLANIRTMMGYEMVEANYRNPFAGTKIRWPRGYALSKPREGLSDEVLNRAFELGIASGQFDEALLPLLACLTGRRLGLLLYLRGSDIREKHEVIVAQTAGILLVNGVWQRVPMKTEESATFFVLHNFLSEIGFVDWARRQGDNWLFPAAHEHSDPAKYASKAMNRLLKRAGAHGGSIETFHSLRGDAIDSMRKTKVQSRAARLQVGHELGSEHDKYGFRALNAGDARKLAGVRLSREIEWNRFRGLDFDRLAGARRTLGRKAKAG